MREIQCFHPILLHILKKDRCLYGAIERFYCVAVCQELMGLSLASKRFLRNCCEGAVNQRKPSACSCLHSFECFSYILRERLEEIRRPRYLAQAWERV